MKKIVTSLALLVPYVAFAQISQPVRDANSLTRKLMDIGNVIIGFLIAIAVIYIVYNALMFIMKAGTDDAATYRKAVLWGIVGLAVILSIWGLVAILTNTFGTAGQPTGPVDLFPQNPNTPVIR